MHVNIKKASVFTFLGNKQKDIVLLLQYIVV